VLVVDDSPLFRNALVAALEKAPDLEVITPAENGREAIDLIHRHHPEVVTMDVNMPVMTGYEAVEEVMATCPTPIMILTGSPSKQERGAVIRALGMGAVDVVPKPDLSRTAEADHAFGQIIEKIKLFSKARVIRHVAGALKQKHWDSPAATGPVTQLSLVAIASSTGGPAAVAEILTSLPVDLAAAVVVAQHIADGFAATFVEWLSAVSALDIREGESGHVLKPGNVAIAPGGRHMRVDSAGRLQLIDSQPVHGCKPSADILLSSVSKAFGRRAVGLVLSGMGRDGTEGLEAIRTNGGKTIAQDEATSVIFGMPKSAIEAGAADKILPLGRIADEIVRLVGRRLV